MPTWFRKNKSEANLPDFWKQYAEHFQDKQSEDLNEVKFVVLDTETTGFDIENDRILSIGAVTIANSRIKINENFEVYLRQETFNPETVKIHGLIQHEKGETYSEIEALEKFLGYIENSILVAHHARFDIKMINKALLRHELPKLKNRVLDTAVLYRRTRLASNLIDRDRSYSLDEIAENYNIELHDRHTAAGDAYITALIFMKLLATGSKGKQINLKKAYRI